MDKKLDKNRFKLIRSLSGMSKKELGEHLGRTGKMIANYESGSKIPDFISEKMLTLEQELKVKLNISEIGSNVSESVIAEETQSYYTNPISKLKITELDKTTIMHYVVKNWDDLEGLPAASILKSKISTKEINNIKITHIEQMMKIRDHLHNEFGIDLNDITF